MFAFFVPVMIQLYVVNLVMAYVMHYWE